MNGPRLGDMDFFNALDLEQDGMRDVRQAVWRADWRTAQSAFVEYLRTRARPLWFSNWKDRRDPHPRHDVEGLRVGDDGVRNVDLRVADKVAANTIQHCSVEHAFGYQIDWELNPSNNREWTRRLNRHAHWLTLGQAHWKTNEEKYAEAFVRQLRHWVTNVLVPVGEDGNAWKEDARCGTHKTNAWRTIECGIRAGQTWPYALHYFLASSSFGDESVCLMAKSFVEQARHLLRWPGEHQAIEANGLYHTGVLFPEFKEADEWRRVAISRLEHDLDHQVYPDGAQSQLSSAYQHTSLRNYVMAHDLALLNNLQIPDGFVPNLERMYDYDLYRAMPDLRLPALNDGEWTDVRPWMKDAVDFFPSRKDFRWAATEGAEGTKPATHSIAFPCAGHFVMRTGWDKSDAYLLFDGGPVSRECRHDDKLNIIVYSHGRVHVTDPGTYPEDGSKWSRYVASTRAHNTVLVDGFEQNRPGMPREVDVSATPDHTWLTEEQFDYASATYDEGYGHLRSKSVRHTRSILFIKPDLWIVTDFLSSTDGAVHRYDVLFHLDTLKADIVGNRKSVETYNRDAGNLGIYGLVPEATELDIISGQEEPVVQGWIPRGRQNECQPLPTAVYRVSGSGTTTATFLLVPIAPGEITPVSFAERGENGRETVASGRVAMRDGRTIRFAMQAATSEGLSSGALSSDGAAFAIVEDDEGAVTEVIDVNGKGISHDGKLVQVGDRLGRL